MRSLLPRGDPYIEGDGQRLQSSWEDAENSIEVVEEAAVHLAVRVMPDEGATVRLVLFSYFSALEWRQKERKHD